MASMAKAESMAFMGSRSTFLDLLDDEPEEGEEATAEEESRIDDIPEWFIGPSMAELVAHELGHTLGLRHNFKASGNYTLAQINSPEFKGQKPLAGSVMDYLPVNAVIKDGELQGDHAMVGIGPYDYWAIEYGYTLGDPTEVLARVADPELQYLSDEDTVGPDPLARRYDLTSNPLDYVENQMKLVNMSREQILTKFVKEGESWARARRGYEITLRNQTGAVSIMANWLGGASINRDHKGDPEDRDPIQVVPAAQQRAALEFVIKNAFFDEAFGLTPELLAKMTVDKWSDEGGRRTRMEDPTWPIHDRIAGVQASTLTMLMNPTVLRRVYDSELFEDADVDVLTLDEHLATISQAVWKEVGLGSKAGAQPVAESSYTVRRPMISNLRRNLQAEHLERLIDLTLDDATSASQKTISLLARDTLRSLGTKLAKVDPSALDAYTRAHLADASHRIEKVLDASYDYGGAAPAGGGVPFIIRFGQDD